MVTAYRLLTCASTLRRLPTLQLATLHLATLQPATLRLVQNTVTTIRSCTLVDVPTAASTITILCSLWVCRWCMCTLLRRWDTRLFTSLMRNLTFSWRPVVTSSWWFTMIKTCLIWLYHLMEFGKITILKWKLLKWIRLSATKSFFNKFVFTFRTKSLVTSGVTLLSWKIWIRPLVPRLATTRKPSTSLLPTRLQRVNVYKSCFMSTQEQFHRLLPWL